MADQSAFMSAGYCGLHGRLPCNGNHRYSGPSLPSIPIFGRISSKSIYCKRLGSVMAGVTAKKGSLSVTAHQGDAQTPLAFNLDKPSAKNLSPFTPQRQPGDKPAPRPFNPTQPNTQP